MQVVYYLPGRRAVGAAELAAVGLCGVLGGRPLQWRDVAAGPDGAAGVVFGLEAPLRPAGEAGDVLPPLGYWGAGGDSSVPPEKAQSWERVGAGPLWVGHYVEARPTPEDMARPEQVGGWRVRLGDGQEWLVPVARAYPEGCELPKRLRLGPAGEWVEQVVERYAGLCERAGAYWRLVLPALEGTGPAGAYKPLEWADLAVEALAVNYHVGTAAVGHLGLLDTPSLQRVLSAVVDLPTYLEVETARRKKARKAEGAE